MCSLNNETISKDTAGVIIIQDSIVTTYVMDVGYIDWNIKEKEQTTDDVRIIRGEYLLERNQITSYLVITRDDVYHYINTNPSVKIRLKRKRL